MKKTIYIHIGTEKTGTKAIQNFCYKHNDFLKENNIYYPCNKNEKYMVNIAHWPLAAVLTKNNKFVPDDKLIDSKEMYDILINDIESIPCDNILISAEPFSVNVTEKKYISKLKEYLSDYDIKIIIYLRRQDNYFVSHTSTKIKGGVYNQSEKFSIQEVLLNKDRYDYYNLLKKWADVFGEDNLFVKVFEKQLFKNENIIDDFFEIFNIDIPKHLDTSSEKNVSLSLDSLYFMNIINGVCNFDKIERTKIFSFLEKRKSKYKIKNLISPVDRCEILKYYEHSNSKVAKEYLGRIDGVLFHEAMPSHSDKWNEFDGLSNEMCLEICDSLLKSKYGAESQKKYIDILVKGTVNEFLCNKSVLNKNTNENCKKKLQIYSLKGQTLKSGNLISWFKKKETGWQIMSEGNDPYFIIPNFNNEAKHKIIVVEIGISVPDNTILQLFYKSNNSKFNENKSVKANVKKNYNKLIFEINSDEPVESLRLDPGAIKGKYILHEFEVIIEK